MRKPSNRRVIKRAEKIPDTLTLVDEDGTPWEDCGPIELDWRGKLLLAELCIVWRQSLETVINRVLRAQIREMAEDE